MFERALRKPRADTESDLTQHLAVQQKDEVGILAEALNGMSVKLRAMVATIQESSEQVASSSEEISASARKLSEGSQSQASSLEETSASVEELAASVDQVAENAQSQASAVEQGTAYMSQVRNSITEGASSLTEISGLADKSVENATLGATAVQQMVSGINLIAQSSQKIGGIVSVISDIADQTNLLALNASIEAARAGEHGRGFAVVAEEVSKLADRSASSTREIEGLIKESVKNVTEGVQTAIRSQTAMEQIRDASRKVKDMIGALSGSMSHQVSATHQLASALNNVNKMSMSISAATEEQTSNARQVSKAVENVNELTRSAASSAEEMSAATDQLTAMAQELQRLTAQFKIDSGGPARIGLITTMTTAKLETSDRPRTPQLQRNGNGNAPATAREFFAWSDAMTVKVRRIDEQHKRLVTMINTMYREMIDKKGLGAQRTTIEEMVDYAATHFKIEEELMGRFKFEGINEHLKAHEAFRMKAMDLKQRSQGEGFIMTIEIVNFLRDWLQKHIMGVDRKYMECFARNGLN